MSCRLLIVSNVLEGSLHINICSNIVARIFSLIVYFIKLKENLKSNKKCNLQTVVKLACLFFAKVELDLLPLFFSDGT